MKKEFHNEEITEAQVITALERAGLKYKNGHRYILSQCPMPEHHDRNPSVQIFKDDWFANCHAACGRFHITKAFPELRQPTNASYYQSKPKVQYGMSQMANNGIIEPWNAQQKTAKNPESYLQPKRGALLVKSIAEDISVILSVKQPEENTVIEKLIRTAISSSGLTVEDRWWQSTGLLWKRSLVESLKKENLSITLMELEVIIGQRTSNFGSEGLGMDNGQRTSYAHTARNPMRKKIDLMVFWQSLPKIPEDHQFKNIPIENLNDLGWRWDASNNRYFIPYFGRSRKVIPFGQWRNLGSGPRFNFWKDAKPTMYGTWNLEPNSKIFLVEGCSDAAVMDFCNIPWVAAPSASSGELVKAMAVWCKQNNIKIIYAGDNDEAGNKLREALDEVTEYRVYQPPKKYKDWGDFFVAEGWERVHQYAVDELWRGDPDREKTAIDAVLNIFGGGKILEVVGSRESKELSGEPTQQSLLQVAPEIKRQQDMG